MTGKASKYERYKKCMTELQTARETNNPKLVKDALEYWIGVAKQFYTVDQLVTWLDFLFSEVDPRGNDKFVDFLRQPYKENGKFLLGEPIEVPKRKLVFKESKLNKT